MKKKLLLLTLIVVFCMLCTACLTQYNAADNPTTQPPTVSTSPETSVTEPGDEIIPPTTGSNAGILTGNPDNSVDEPPSTETEPPVETQPADPPETQPTEPVIPPTTTPTPHVCSYETQRIEATCAQEGKIIHMCECGKQKTETLPKKEHNFTKAETVESTCKKAGKVIYRCACGAEKYTELELRAHQYTESSRVAATCSKAGKITYTCTCGTTKVESIAKAEHNYTLTSTTESTTTVQGKKVYTCTGCSATYTETLPLKPSAKDTDMCGPSLLNKPLKHAKYYDTVAQLFERINQKPTSSESHKMGIIPAPDDVAMNTFWTWWNDTYKYAAYMYWYTSYRYDDPAREDGFLIWGDDDIWAEEAAVHTEVYRILKELGIDSSVTQKEAITRINNYLCESKYYQYDESKRDGSVYHSLFGDNGVCHNYALAFQVLCLGAGIECHYYSSDTMNHAWNKVYFSDGSYYWVDVCWNDARYIINGKEVETSVENGVSAAKVKEIRSRYLLITTEQLLQDHSL